MIINDMENTIIYNLHLHAVNIQSSTLKVQYVQNEEWATFYLQQPRSVSLHIDVSAVSPKYLSFDTCEIVKVAGWHTWQQRECGKVAVWCGIVDDEYIIKYSAIICQSWVLATEGGAALHHNKISFYNFILLYYTILSSLQIRIYITTKVANF